MVFFCKPHLYINRPAPSLYPSFTSPLFFFSLFYSLLFAFFSFDSPQERLALFEEMENHVVELSQLMYSHHIVLRLFKDVKAPEDQKRLAKTFRGNGVRLATHAIGAEVVQMALISLPTASASLIKVPPPPRFDKKKVPRLARFFPADVTAQLRNI